MLLKILVVAVISLVICAAILTKRLMGIYSNLKDRCPDGGIRKDCMSIGAGKVYITVDKTSIPIKSTFEFKRHES